MLQEPGREGEPGTRSLSAVNTDSEARLARALARCLAETIEVSQ